MTGSPIAGPEWDPVGRKRRGGGGGGHLQKPLKLYEGLGGLGPAGEDRSQDRLQSNQSAQALAR